MRKISSSGVRLSPSNLVVNDLLDNEQHISRDASVLNNSATTDEVMVFPVASAFGLPFSGEKKTTNRSSTPTKLYIPDESINGKL